MTLKATLLRHVTRLAFVTMTAGAIALLSPVTVGYAQGMVDRGTSATASGIVGSSGQYVVVKGDSLYGISMRFGLGVDQLKSLNGLNSNAISVGQALAVSANANSGTSVRQASAIVAPAAVTTLASKTYTVQRGDTAYRVARNTGISLADLVAFNNLDDDYGLSVGQVLIVGREQRVQQTQQATQITTLAPVPVDSGYTTGELLSGPVAPSVVEPSQDILISIPAARPQIGATPVAQVPAPSVNDWTQSVPLTNAAADNSGTTTIELARRRLEDTKITTHQNEQLFLPSSPTAGSGDRRFAWPVRGRLLSNFGPREGGLVNDGINIAVRSGEAVKAAAAGKVLYASDEMDAFGNLVLLEHAEGWVTAYAHNDRLTVSKGDIVQQGQTIARAGSSGTVDRSQLHFEVRQDGKPVNPMTVLAY